MSRHEYRRHLDRVDIRQVVSDRSRKTVRRRIHDVVWFGGKTKMMAAMTPADVKSMARNNSPLPKNTVEKKRSSLFVITVDIAGLVRQQRRRRFGIDREYAFLSFLFEIGLEFFPNRLCAFGGPYEKFLIAGVRRNIADDEIAHRYCVIPSHL
jgi:hypothetical protein